MSWKELKRMVLAIIHVTEQIREKRILPQERGGFRKGLRGEGNPISLADDCGACVQLFARKGRFLLRISLPTTATQNGCLDEAKRWTSRYEEALRGIAAALGRRYLPIEIVVVTVASDGVPLSFEGKVSLDRGG